jgi:hypothetical protein
MTWVNLSLENLFFILKILQEHHHPKMQGRKKETEEFHHRVTNFISIVLFRGFIPILLFETAYKKKSIKVPFKLPFIIISRSVVPPCTVLLTHWWLC